MGRKSGEEEKDVMMLIKKKKNDFTWEVRAFDPFYTFKNNKKDLDYRGQMEVISLG